MMVEIFQGGKATVQREVNQWFAENPDIHLVDVLQGVVRDHHCLHSELTITVIYEQGFYRDAERTLEAAIHG